MKNSKVLEEAKSNLEVALLSNSGNDQPSNDSVDFSTNTISTDHTTLSACCSFRFFTLLLKLYDMYHYANKESAGIKYTCRILSILMIFTWVWADILYIKSQSNNFVKVVAVIYLLTLIMFRIMITYEFALINKLELPWKSKLIIGDVNNNENDIDKTMIYKLANLVYYTIVINIIILVSQYGIEMFMYPFVWYNIISFFLHNLFLLLPLICVSYICLVLLKYIFQLKKMSKVLSNTDWSINNDNNDNNNDDQSTKFSRLVIIELYMKLYGMWDVDWSWKTRKWQLLIIIISTNIMTIVWIRIGVITTFVEYTITSAVYAAFATFVFIVPFFLFVAFGSLMTKAYYQCLNVVSDQLTQCYCNVMKDDNNDKIMELIKMVTMMKTYPITVSVGGFLVSFDNVIKLLFVFAVSRVATILVQYWSF